MNKVTVNGVLSVMLTLGGGALEQAPNTSLQQPETPSTAQITIHSPDDFCDLANTTSYNQEAASKSTITWENIGNYILV